MVNKILEHINPPDSEKDLSYQCEEDEDSYFDPRSVIAAEWRERWYQGRSVAAEGMNIRTSVFHER